MTKRSIEDLRSTFATPDKEKPEFVNNYYPFWNMEAGQKVVIRFLPDKDDTNPRGFLAEKTFHKLTINGQSKTVPCLSMYGEECPICKASQAYYKSKDEVNGKKYWRKKQYIAQALVIEDPLPPDPTTGETHQGKVRYFALGYQLYNIIKEAFASEDDPLESVPYDFENGYDFIIKKTVKGKFADYTVGTKFLSRSRTLTEMELEVADEGMIELATLLPKNPGVEKVTELLNADLSGDEYQDENGNGDDDSDGGFTPAKPKTTSNTDDTPAPAPKKAEPKAETKSEDSSSSTGTNDVDAMLAAIRARRAAAGN